MSKRSVRRDDLKVGDEVVFLFRGDRVWIEGETRLVLRDDDILGVVEAAPSSHEVATWQRIKP